MQPHVLGDRMSGASGVVKTQPDFVLLNQIGSAIARAGLRSAISRQAHAERRAVIVRRLLGVAYIKLHVVGSIQRKKILLHVRIVSA